ncbi:protein of unknown function [Nitrosomonas sp. Nm51]|uniref:DUF4340 domain-containing protein n=1 Tax=Nitrosomonas sp. Nm51 TaxID=133720 RepID=UPI0008AD73B8|nr:DUF4340 domain-containing protein [Nitrosomonas sp. Nm51]SER35797.1 protein of unknown function [Nitrosomonas sp. Nm51]
MTYHSQINLIMLATIIGLAFFLYLTPQFQSETDDAFQVSLRTPESVQSVRIVRQGQEIELRRIGGDWHLMTPVFARADGTLVKKMLNVLSANSRQRFPLRDVENFNLDQPLVELYIDDEHFAFGGLAPVTNEQYLAINGDVYLVSPRYATWVPVDPLDLADSKLLADDELPVRFELNGVSIRQQNGAWQTDAGNGNYQSSEALERWVNSWRDYRAPELLMKPLQDSEGTAAGIINLQDGRSIIITAVEHEYGTAFYRDNEQIGYLFPESVSRKLLNPVATEHD